jgi:site-specific recombinase XerD
MAGCRALTDNEVKVVRKSFSGVYKRRNEALFVLGVRAGFRISELLSLQVKDVLQYGKLVDRVEVSRRHMKGGKAGKASSRSVPLHPEARAALSVWLEVLTVMLKGTLDPQTPVFCSRVKDAATGLRRAISREQAWRILKEAYTTNELSGKLATHSMRKTFATRVHAHYHGDLLKTQKALGHANINSTIKYLALDEAEVDAGILAA